MSILSVFGDVDVILTCNGIMLENLNVRLCQHKLSQWRIIGIIEDDFFYTTLYDHFRTQRARERSGVNRRANCPMSAGFEHGGLLRV